MVFRRKKIKCKDWLPLAGPGTESVRAPLLFLFCGYAESVNVTLPGLAYSHTVTRNSFGFRGHHPSLATYVSPAIRTPFWDTDGSVAANPCKTDPVLPLHGGTSVRILTTLTWRYFKKHWWNRAFWGRLSFLWYCSDLDAFLT